MGQFGPEMVFCVLHPRDVEVLDTWVVSGLRATSTQDLRVEDLFVPREFTGGFSLATGPRAVRECTLARFPLFALLGLSQSAPVALGLARRAIDDFRSLAPGKQTGFSGMLSDQVQAQAGLARAEALLRAGRCYFFGAVRDAWERVRGGASLSLEDRAELRMAALTAVENSVAAVDIVFRLAGTSSLFESQGIERTWRDIHAAGQHHLVQEGRWETVGRVLFGMEPASPFI
jgi:alkylation response protein AidB-like acyl-CoA dehydrogenase